MFRLVTVICLIVFSFTILKIRTSHNYTALTLAYFKQFFPETSFKVSITSDIISFKVCERNDVAAEFLTVLTMRHDGALKLK
jgi:hypothetical protein